MKRLLAIIIIPLLIMATMTSCTSTNCTSTSTSFRNGTEFQSAEIAESQARGKGTVEYIEGLVFEGIYSAKLTLPKDYKISDAARIAVPVEGITLNEIESLSFWCYIDEKTPTNPDGKFWTPYITFEIDTDGKPGCDTWVIGGGSQPISNSGVWFEHVLENGHLFHVSSTVADYVSPFPLSNMGTLTQISATLGPDGKVLLGDCPISKIRIAIGNWGPGGPVGPIIYYVDNLACNGELLY